MLALHGGKREMKEHSACIFLFHTVLISFSATIEENACVTSQCVSIRLGLVAIGRQACGDDKVA